MTCTHIRGLGRVLSIARESRRRNGRSGGLGARVARGPEVRSRRGSLGILLAVHVGRGSRRRRGARRVVVGVVCITASRVRRVASRHYFGVKPQGRLGGRGIEVDGREGAESQIRGTFKPVSAWDVVASKISLVGVARKVRGGAMGR